MSESEATGLAKAIDNNTVDEWKYIISKKEKQINNPEWMEAF